MYGPSRKYRVLAENIRYLNNRVELIVFAVVREVIAMMCFESHIPSSMKTIVKEDFQFKGLQLTSLIQRILYIRIRKYYSYCEKEFHFKI